MATADNLAAVRLLRTMGALPVRCGAGAVEYEITLEPAQARRNLVTRGVPLNHLIGREFAVGDVVLRGLRLCEPCGHLEKLTIKGIEKSLRHRGGLRAQVVQGGVLRSGDTITPTACRMTNA